MRKPGVITKAQMTAICKGGLSSGAKLVTVEATMPNGTKLKMTAHADDPTKQPSNGDEMSAEDALATWPTRKTKNEIRA